MAVPEIVSPQASFSAGADSLCVVAGSSPAKPPVQMATNETTSETGAA